MGNRFTVAWFIDAASEYVSPKIKWPSVRANRELASLRFGGIFRAEHTGYA
jgi:hypothetical protein